MNAPKAAVSLSFALKTGLSQALAFSTALITWPLLPFPVSAIAIATLCAYLSARFLQLPRSWRVVNSALPSMAALSLSFTIPAWAFLIPLVGLISVYAPTLWTRVPYYPSQRGAYALLLAELPSDRPFVFVDVGSGFCDLLFFLGEKRPLGTFIGIEVGPLPWLLSNLKRLVWRRKNISIIWCDMWRYPLTSAQYVYTFLSPAAMERMWEKAQREMTSPSTFITNSFPVADACDEELDVRDHRGSKLYIHRMGR